MSDNPAKLQETFPINTSRLSESEVQLLVALNKGNQSHLDRLGTSQKAKKYLYADGSLITHNFFNFLNLYITEHEASLDPKMVAGLKAINDHYRALQGSRISISQAEFEARYRTHQDFDAKTAISSFIENQDVGGDIKTHATNLLQEQWENIINITQKWRKLEKIHFYSQWASGEFTYDDPIFPSYEEFLKLMILQIPFFIDTLLRDDLQEKASSDIVTDALAELWKRVSAHEEQLQQKLKIRQAFGSIEQRSREEARALAEAEKTKTALERHAREAEAATQRAVAEQQRRKAFMASPQAYTLETNAVQISTLLSHLAGSTAGKAPHARLLMETVDKARKGLDIRGDGVKEVGDMLFSATNLTAAAQAFDADSPLKSITRSDRKIYGAAQLRTLYIASSPVREAVDRLLQTPDGIILLATLTRDPERCKKYGKFLLDSKSELATIAQRLGKLKTSLAGFTDADLAQMEDESQVKALREAQKTLAEKQATIDNAQKDLAGEIRRAFAGVSSKRIASAEVPVLSGGHAEIKVSETWQKEMAKEFYADPSPQGEKYLRIASNEFPFKYFDIKRSAGDSTFLTQLQQLRSVCEQYRTNMEMVGELGKASGFRVTTQADGKLELRHEEYNIAVSLAGPEAEVTVALLKAKAQFQEREFQQQAMLENAAQAGIILEGVDAEKRAQGAITLRNEVFNYTIAPRGYFSADEFALVQHLIDQTQSKPRLAHVAVLGELPKPEDKPTKWEPEQDQTLIIFDATTLIKLAAQRGDNGHTWLDIIKCTARLPNVKVVIPAVVAEWELQGKIPLFDEQGHYTHSEVIDTRFQDPAYPALSVPARSVNSFLKSASRAKIEADGTVHFQPNENRNVIVMDTDGDKELYAHIREIKNDKHSDQIARFRDEIKGKDAGENAIDRIIETMPFIMPAMIVSDDRKYFRRRELTSTQGMPVGQTGTGCYLDAEIRAREPVVRHILRETAPLSLFRLGNDINAYWAKVSPDEGTYLNRHSMRGVSHSGEVVAEHIYGLIERGAKKAAEIATAHAGSNGGKSVGRNGLSPKPEAGAIDPAKFKDRGGASPPL